MKRSILDANSRGDDYVISGIYEEGNIFFVVTLSTDSILCDLVNDPVCFGLC